MFGWSDRYSYAPQKYARGPVIDGVVLHTPQRFVDDGGSFMELGRFGEFDAPWYGSFQLRQVNLSELEPGLIRGWHIHPAQTDIWFVPGDCRVLVCLWDIRTESKTHNVVMRVMMGYGTNRQLLIPPGVAHGARNLGDRVAKLIYFTDRHFTPDPLTTEEWRMSYHEKPGRQDLWEPTNQ